jgi:hydrogenase-4 component F
VADLIATLALLTPLAPVVVAAAVLFCRSATAADRAGRWGGLAAATPAAALAVLALTRAGQAPETGSWWLVDAPGCVFLATIALVGAGSAAVSPAYLRANPSSRAGAVGSRHLYWVAFHLFWAALLAVPLVDNLGIAWILIEATTAASALLVAFSGKRSALEAGWKYLVLTSVGLTIALFGIVILYAAAAAGAGSLAVLDWSELAERAPAIEHDPALAAFVLVVAGLATKVGWAPVHNWLPDAHSEAPPPVSALLSAALLPAVALVAWRLALALEPAVGEGTVRTLFVGFGLVSLAVAVPFLWRPLPWKRLLAYSSLEHMGVIAIAIGFQHPLATAGALLHVLGHGIAKSLGFYATIPLLRYQPAAGRRPPRGLAALSRPLAGTVGLSLGTLSGLPPSPLFLSEILVLSGGFAAGLAWASALAAVMLALGFLGMAHVLVEGLAGRPSGRRPSSPRGLRQISVLALVAAASLIALSVLGYELPDSDLVRAFAGGA